MDELFVMILYQLKWNVRTIKRMGPFGIWSYEESIFYMLDMQNSYLTAKFMQSTIQLDFLE
jgi:hypothetical protein